MKNKFLVCGLISGMLLASNVYADPSAYGTSQLQLNTQIIDMMNSSTRQSSEYYQNQKGTSTQVKTAKPASSSQINSAPNSPSYHLKPAYQDKMNKTPSQNTSVHVKDPVVNTTPSFQIKPAFQEKINSGISNISSPIKSSGGISQGKNLSEKDLQIEGRIEKTQKESLYQNQSPAELQAMVNRIGKGIIKANGITTTIQFKYDESDVANANTNFNGTIRVYKGLIKYCEDEDELAYVIGHEIGHAVSHHVAKGIAVNVGGATASTAATMAVEHATKSKWATLGTGIAADVLVGLGKTKISRVMETNADLLSIDYVVKAGYNPLASIAIMNKIGENYVDFWADHPSTDKRVVMMYDYVKKKYPSYLANGYDSTFYDQALEDYIYNKAMYQKLSKEY